MTYMATESLSGILLYSIVGCLRSMPLPSQKKEQPWTTVLVSLTGQCGRFPDQERCRELFTMGIRESGHALKFQSVATPNGLIANMFGPVGKFHHYFKFNMGK